MVFKKNSNVDKNISENFFKWRNRDKTHEKPRNKD